MTTRFLIQKRFLSLLPRMDAIASVKIDPEGVFKYIQISLQSGDAKKVVIRGDGTCEYHADILDKVTDGEFGRDRTITASCLGGGRIRHDPAAKSILVYGYSVGFGRADHTATVRLLKEQYPAYKIDYSNDGY
ncbi:sex-regulated protein janus-A-like [Sycon ciliatum]|uniref:sex-regulated protein janus-A-like n=1 Tax=Sycon ciliatum TaxID=27933 RepID=UPI0031F6D777|eukprot:scpid17496/ scgid16098/ Sex-regulated protein janus-A